MADVCIKTYIDKDNAIHQCDIFSNVEYIEYIKEEEMIFEYSKITFPNVIVLTQACDLAQDNALRKQGDKIENHDQLLVSVIVAPIYNFEDLRVGDHLKQLGMNMQNMGGIKKSKCENIIKNENKRYHYLRFEDNVKIVNSVIDFKHYFSCNAAYLLGKHDSSYICSIDSLYREFITQRFSNFLSRIGLPDPVE